MARTLADLWAEVIDMFERKDWDRVLKRCIVILRRQRCT